MISVEVDGGAGRSTVVTMVRVVNSVFATRRSECNGAEDGGDSASAGRSRSPQ